MAKQAKKAGRNRGDATLKAAVTRRNKKLKLLRVIRTQPDNMEARLLFRSKYGKMAPVTRKEHEEALQELNA